MRFSRKGQSDARDRAVWLDTAVRDNTARIRAEAATLCATYRQACTRPGCPHQTHAVPFADRIDQIMAQTGTGE